MSDIVDATLYDEDDLDGIFELARIQIDAGFFSLDSIIESAVLAANDFEASDEVLEHVVVLVEGMWAARLDDQNSWGEVAGDRLDAAFADLNRQGVIARQSGACCTACGHDDLQTESENREDSIGYVFFHHEDAEALGEGVGSLQLAFGAGVPGVVTHDTDDGRVTAIGACVRDTLTSHGFVVRWDDNPNQKIVVDGMEWKKRLPVT